jgi:hypothetical protein
MNFTIFECSLVPTTSWPSRAGELDQNAVPALVEGLQVGQAGGAGEAERERNEAADALGARIRWG